MRLRSLGFQTDLMIRRLAGSEIDDRGDHIVVRTPNNPDYYWGNFVVFAAPPGPGDGVRYVARFAAALPGARHLAIGLDGVDGDSGTILSVLGSEAKLEVHAVMAAERLCPPTRRPVDAVCRPLASDDDWEQERRLRGEMADDEGETSPAHHAFLARRVREVRALSEGGHGAAFGAFVGRRLCAVAGIYSEPGGVGRYQDVATHPVWRGRGLASVAVWRAGMHGLTAMRCRSLVIVADPAGPAISLYRRLGFDDRQRQVQVTRAPET